MTDMKCGRPLCEEQENRVHGYCSSYCEDRPYWETENAALREVLEDIMECPYAIDQATVPKAGFDAKIEQVVGVMSMSLWKYRKAKALLSETEEE